MAPKKDTAKKEIASKQGDLREEKMKALESALAQLNKTYGKGAVMKFGDAAADANLQVIPTGCLELDMALGVGGLPRGRVVEIYGPESSGKTTVALHCVAEAQKMGGVCAFIDAEHALDPVYARKLGVNVDELYISQPDTGEQKRWCVPGPSTWWSSTPWPRWCPGRRSRAKWATASWVCRPV